MKRRRFLYSLTGVFSALILPPVIRSFFTKVTDPVQLAIEKIKYLLTSTTNKELVTKIQIEFENEDIKEFNGWILSSTEADILSKY